MEGDAPRFVAKRGSALASGVLATIVIGCVIFAIFGGSQLDPDQRSLFRFLIAVGSGAFATFFLGGVAMEGTVGNFRIAAGGGFALFLIMLLVVDPLPERPTLQNNTVERGSADAPKGYSSEASTPNDLDKSITEHESDELITSIDGKALENAAQFVAEGEGAKVVVEQNDANLIYRLKLFHNLNSDAAVAILLDTIVLMGPQRTEDLARESTQKAGIVRSESSEKRWLRDFVNRRFDQIGQDLPQLKNAMETRRQRNLALIS